MHETCPVVALKREKLLKPFNLVCDQEVSVVSYHTFYILTLLLNFDHDHHQESVGNVVKLLLDMGGLRARMMQQPFLGEGL